MGGEKRKTEFSFCCLRTQGEVSCPQARKRVPSSQNPAMLTPWAGTSSRHSCKFLLFKAPSLWYFVLALELTGTTRFTPLTSYLSLPWKMKAGIFSVEHLKQKHLRCWLKSQAFERILWREKLIQGPSSEHVNTASASWRF